MPGAQEGRLFPLHCHNRHRLINVDFTFLEFACILFARANKTKDITVSHIDDRNTQMTVKIFFRLRLSFFLDADCCCVLGVLGGTAEC